jgi:2-keto-4-pentenoate hydratase/2-oxohepta-3-ene-1,7-dioic acid hydratase in catechol pathway
MRLVCFTAAGVAPAGPRFGALLPDGEHVLDFRPALDSGDGPPSSADVLAWCDLAGPLFAQARALYDKIAGGASELAALGERGAVLPRSGVRLLAPVPRPGKIIAIGLNYRDHAAESKMPIPTSPIVFSKFTTAVVGPDQPVVLPPTSEKVDYEAELAVVIGRRARQVPAARAFDYVLGYMNLNDVSARDFQFADGQWQRGKSCDTFAPMGPYIATTDEVADPHRLPIKLRLNGQTMQDSNTNQLIFGVPELIAFLSETITLEPGDVIATGTPPGVGFARTPPVFLKPGDVMEVEVEGLGVLSNPLAAAPGLTD